MDRDLGMRLLRQRNSDRALVVGQTGIFGFETWRAGQGQDFDKADAHMSLPPLLLPVPSTTWACTIFCPTCTPPASDTFQFRLCFPPPLTATTALLLLPALPISFLPVPPHCLHHPHPIPLPFCHSLSLPLPNPCLACAFSLVVGRQLLHTDCTHALRFMARSTSAAFPSRTGRFQTA